MTQKEQQQLGKTLWDIADNMRGAMNADDFRDYMLSFLFLRYLSYNYEVSEKKELGKDYPNDTPKECFRDALAHKKSILFLVEHRGIEPLTS